MDQLPICEQFQDQHPDFWPNLDRETAYEVFCEELRSRIRQEAHDDAQEAAERAEIMAQCFDEEEAEDRIRHPEFRVKTEDRNPCDEGLDTDADAGVFHG